MSRAFAPAHVSGVFAVHDEEPDPLKKGSRGAGWSLDDGAAAQVVAGDSLRIRIDGEVAEAPVTRAALARLAPGRGLHVELRLGLPVGQGFGMSAAGTLAACLAATDALGLEPELALEAAHAAEVESGTGLGDVVGSWFGSGEVRMKPGCPPHGWALRIEPPAGTRFLFCVLGRGIPTPSIIRDAAWKRKTRELGDPAVDRILAAKREGAWERILLESSSFGQALGLMPAEMRRLGGLLPESCTWGQSMLGNTMWVTGPETDLEVARRVLVKGGLLLDAGVDGNGARMLR
ncbi:MAG: GHMP family kinase ATP-binding protein [Thermoplasmatota archaeon]